MKPDNIIFLGAAVLRVAVSACARTVVLDVPTHGDAMADELGEASRFPRTDVTSDDDAAAAVWAAIETFGRMDVLINCAGVDRAGRLCGLPGRCRLADIAGGTRTGPARDPLHGNRSWSFRNAMMSGRQQDALGASAPFPPPLRRRGLTPRASKVGNATHAGAPSLFAAARA